MKSILKLSRIFNGDGHCALVKTGAKELHKLNTLLEQRVRECTAELEKKNADLETVLKAIVGRELRMVELKEKIAKLEKWIWGKYNLFC